MASISTDRTTGRRAVQFVARNGKRKTIRLGKCTARQAETARDRIEDLAAAARTGGSPKPATLDWLAAVPSTIRKRLERTGLIAARERPDCPTVADHVAAYVRGRPDVKTSTRTVYGHTRRNLKAFMGAKRLDEVTPADADAFRVHLATVEGLADNTVRRRTGIAKQFFRAAVRANLIARNPFDGLASTVRENRKRQVFVTREQAEAVIAELPSPAWRLAFALARYGGLRCPSEIVRLRWEDVAWDRQRFTVHASKTERHADAGIRVVPIFPELAPYLLAAFDAAEDGAVFCCPQESGAWYRKLTGQAVKRAGLRP